MSWNHPTKYSLAWIRKSLENKPSFFRVQSTFNNKGRNISHNGNIRFDTAKATVRLHNTDIVTLISSGAVFINTGGYSTVTTKRWINLFSGLGITQKNWQWCIGHDTIDQYAVKTPNGLLFTDGAYRVSHLRQIWQELETNADSENWAIEQWEDFLGVIRLTIE